MSARRARSESDPERRDRDAHANELLLAVAARLLGEARLAGAFPTAERGLTDFAAEISLELAGDEHVLAAPDERTDLPRADYKVVLSHPEPGSISVGCWYDNYGDRARLRIDGVLEEQLSSFGVRFDDAADRVELPPVEQEVMSVARARRREADRPRFRGEEFLRALPVEPRPGAAVQILAVELYGDGLVVHHTYDDPVDVRPRVPFEYYDLAGIGPPLEELLAAAEAEGGNLSPNVTVADDLGTRYVGGLAGEGGVEVVHGESRFTPAVPAEATRLIVSSYAGPVELRL
jgi:hypothetical protein